MFTQREIDEILMEAEAEVAELLAEIELEFLGERADYVLPKEVDNAGTETEEEEIYVQTE